MKEIDFISHSNKQNGLCNNIAFGAESLYQTTIKTNSNAITVK